MVNYAPITSRPIANPLSGEEDVAIVQAGTTKRTTTGAISALPIGQGTANSGISFITVSTASSALPNSRVLAAASPVTLTDNGTGNTLVVGLSFTPGSGTVTSIGLSPGTTGLTISNSPITVSGTMTIGGTLVAPHGGTGTTTIAANRVLIGDTVGSSIASITSGTAGLLLASNGLGLPPSFRGFITTIRVGTASGTYTPTPGMQYVIMEGFGGGGAGGGAVAAANQLATGGGGAGGGYTRVAVSSATVGVSQAFTIGAGGLPGATGSSNGGVGGTTSVGGLLTARGGAGGFFGQNGVQFGAGGTGTFTAIGDFTAAGRGGGAGNLASIITIAGVGGRGGDGVFSGGANGAVQSGSGAQAGLAAGSNSGAGGSGAAEINGTTGPRGGTGGSGGIIFTEFIIA